MGRRAQGWRFYRGPGQIRFTHQGHRYTIATGQSDPQRAADAAARIYADVVAGKAVKVVRAFGAPPLDILFAEWLASLEGILDERTVDTYKTTYVKTHFMPFFDSVATLNEGKIVEYARTRLKQVLKTTLRKELGALRQFMLWLKQNDYIEALPRWPEFPKTATGKRTGKQRAKAQELSPAEVVAIIAALPEWSQSRKDAPFAVRARFVVAWETGLRPATLDAITWRDLADGRTLTIRAEIDKARHARVVPLTEAALRALASVWTEGAGEDDPVFGKHDYRPALAKAALAAGLETVCPYDLRHARATYLTQASGNLLGVAHLLGHRQVTTTNKYLHSSQTAAEQVFGAIAVHETSGIVRRTGIEPVRVISSLEPESSGYLENTENPENGTPQKPAQNDTSPHHSGAPHHNSFPLQEAVAHLHNLRLRALGEVE